MLAYNPALDNVVIVLYQPQDVVNVAAIIRVMSNFGLSHLRLVEPAAFDPYRIEGIAHHTEPLIQATRRFATLDDALADCGLVLGTTGRPRQGERLVLAPRQAAPYVLEGARSQRVAILFGPEQDGLPNAALDRCHGMITIPTHPYNRSLNLAQAALVIAYDLWMEACAGPTGVQASAAPAGAQASVAPAGGESGGAAAGGLPPVALPPADLAGGAEREALFGALEGLLTALYPSTTPERLSGAMGRLRTLLMRAQPRQEEAEALTNLLRHAARRVAQKVAPGD
jgi:TrmH family RNA methyltransferase